MFEDLYEFALRNQEQILVGLASFLGWFSLVWSKNKALKWYKGSELVISEDVKEVIRILQEKRRKIIESPEILVTSQELIWEKVISINLNHRILQTKNPVSSIPTNYKEREVIRAVLTELSNERVNRNKMLALEQMKCATAPIEKSKPEPEEVELSFAKGEVVMLKSGGPKMTVYSGPEMKPDNNSLSVMCGYFNSDNNKYNQEKFFIHELIKCENSVPAKFNINENVVLKVNMDIRMTVFKVINCLYNGYSYECRDSNGAIFTFAEDRLEKAKTPKSR